MTDVTENTETPNNHLECVQRISKLPVVELMWNHTTGMYEKVKGSNSVVNWTLSSAEATVSKAMQHAAPVAKKFEQPIHKMDETLCKGLDTLEEKVPVVKEKPEQVYEATKNYVSATMQPAMDKLESMKRFGTAVGNYARISLDATVEMADQYVDYYLPEEKPESTVLSTEEGAIEIHEDQSMPQKVGRISVKVGRGVYRTISAQMKAIGVTSEKSLASLSHLSELLHLNSINVDSTALAARASQLWAQLSKDDDLDDVSEGEEKTEKHAPGNVAVAGVVARKLVKNVLNLVTQAAKTLPIPPGPLAATASAIPSQLGARLEAASEHAKGMYTQLKTYNFHEASDSLKDSMKEQIGKIQSVVHDLNSYANQWLEANSPDEQTATAPQPEITPGGSQQTGKDAVKGETTAAAKESTEKK